MNIRSKKPAKKIIRRRVTERRLAIHQDRRHAFVSESDLQTLLYVSARTARHYLSHPGAIPEAKRELLYMKALGLHPGMPGAVIENNAVTVYNGLRFNQEQLIGLTWTHQEIGQLRRETTRLEQKIARLETVVEFWRDKAGAPLAMNDEI